MQQHNDTTNADHDQRLIDRLPELGAEGLGSVMLRLAHMAAAQHRAQTSARSVEPWQGLSDLCFESMDNPEQGCSAQTRSAREHGPVTTEGDR